MGLDAEECLPSVTVGDGPSGVTSSQRRGRGGRSRAREGEGPVLWTQHLGPLGSSLDHF